MHPTLDLNFFEVSLYTALIALGAGVGLLGAFLFLRFPPASLRPGMPSRRAVSGVFLDGALLLFASGWVGARLYHVLTHFEYYQARPEQLVDWGALPGSPLQGGLGIRGALIVGLIVLFLYARARRLSFGALADAGALGLAVGQAVGWVGALAQGANYGVIDDSRWALDLPDLYGLVQPRFPLQHVEILLFAFIFVILVIGALRCPRAGQLFLIYLLLASASQVALGFQRGDETARVGMLRVDQIVDATLAGLALIGLIRQQVTKPTARPVGPAAVRTGAWKGI